MAGRCSSTRRSNIGLQKQVEALLLPEGALSPIESGHTAVVHTGTHIPPHSTPRGFHPGVVKTLGGGSSVGESWKMHEARSWVSIGYEAHSRSDRIESFCHIGRA